MVVNGRPLKRAKSRVAASSPLDLIPHNQPIDLDAIADLRDSRQPSDLISPLDLPPRGTSDLINPHGSPLSLIGPRGSPIDLIGTRGSSIDLIGPRGSPTDLIRPRGGSDLVGPRGVLDLDVITGEGDVGRPFRDSVRAVCTRYGRMSGPRGGEPTNVVTWQIGIRAGGADVGLCVVDEDVVGSRSVYCDQCKVVGWSGHPVCAKRYHFIIRNENRSAAAALSSCHSTGCVHCGSPLLVTQSSCMTCKLEGRAGIGPQENHTIQLDDVSHLLHAVVHSNGYGHLLRVNGHQGGSKHLTGRHIMFFWDRLCKFLHVRKVTVMDISKKHGMEYRLLHSVTAGHPWYGEWGYKFGAGSYGVNFSSYHSAVETLSNLPLSLFSVQNRTPRTQLQDLISLYRSLSDQNLLTVRDLFKYITHLLHESSRPLSKPLKMTHAINSTTTTSVTSLGFSVTSGGINVGDCDEVESVKRGMIRVLRAVGGKWVGWRALRGATSKAARSVDVLDRGMKELGGEMTEDGFVVAARCNSQTNTLEYRLEAAGSQQSILDCTAFSKPSSAQLLRDLKFLFNSLLNPSTLQPYKPQSTHNTALKSAAIILDCKQFIKSYDSNPLPLNPFMLQVWCVIELTDHTKDYTVPPPELLVISASATISDLKLHVAHTFQEIYPIFQGFHAESVMTNASTSESALVKHVVNPNEVIRVRGRCLGDNMGKLGLGQYRMERGLENWTVDCKCGAKDDDGERMMACDTCGVWQHTRCSGIRDSDEVPGVFVCVKCVKNKGNKGKGEMCNVNSGKKVGRIVMMSECK